MGNCVRKLIELCKMTMLSVFDDCFSPKLTGKIIFFFLPGMMHALIGFLFDVITCQLKLKKKEEKVSFKIRLLMYVYI